MTTPYDCGVFSDREPTGMTARRLDDEFHRLVAGLHERGFEALRLDADTPEQGIVDSVLSIIDQMSALAGLSNGWHVQAQNLRPGMVVDFGPWGTWKGGEPAQLHIVQVTAAEETGMVHLHGPGGFVSRAIAADWPFEIYTRERAALEDGIIGAERNRLART